LENEKIGFMRAIFRYFRYWDWKKARGNDLTAEEQFTASLDNLSDVFDIQYKKMQDQARGLAEDIKTVESALEAKRARFKELDKEKEELLRQRENAINQAEEAKAANNRQAYKTHAQNFDRLQTQLDEINKTWTSLNQGIIEASQNLDRFKLELKNFQAQIDLMPKQKEETIANLIAAQNAIKENDRGTG
jgi:chromosome segregation ATPase